MTTPPDTLARLKQLHEAATPGPWENEKVRTDCGHCFRIMPASWTEKRYGGICAYDDRTSLNPHNEGEQEANATLMAELRNALPDILSDLQKLREVERIVLSDAVVYDTKLVDIRKILTRQPE